MQSTAIDQADHTCPVSNHGSSVLARRRRIDRRWRGPDHSPVPARLPGPLTETLPAKYKGEDEDKEEAKTDHSHSHKCALHADGSNHGIDVEGYHEGDDVFEATY